MFGVDIRRDIGMSRMLLIALTMVALIAGGLGIPALAASGSPWASLLPPALHDLMVAFRAASGAGNTITVGPGGAPTYDHAKIQAAIDAADNGDTIQVAAGTYTENLVWNDKDLQLIGAGQGQSIVNGGAGINGGGSCLRMANVPGTSRIEGFTFTNGLATGSWPLTHGGGIYMEESSPTITNTTISGNTASWTGGGLYLDSSSPTISNTTISGNTANNGQGGGLATSGSSPSISNTTISDNEAYQHGGGLQLGNSSSATITNTTISGNKAGSTGGGLAVNVSSPTISNTTISGNEASAGLGGGIYVSGSASSPAITNSVIAFSTAGGGIRRHSGNITISYSNVFGNVGGNYINMVDPTGSDGNISAEPLFADAAAGDFHLKSRGGRWDPVAAAWVIDAEHSPCIDAGDPTMAVGDEPDPHGDRINMGRWGGTQFASKAAPPPPTVVYVDENYGPGLPNDGHVWSYDAFDSIQDGIDAVAESGTVNVAAGTYTENLVWNDKDLQLIGAGQGQSIVNGGAGINGGGSCLRMANVPDTSRIEGFTFTNGMATGHTPLDRGGGLYLTESSPTIIDTTISGNTSGGIGGGLFLSDSSPTITGATISDNTGGGGGGGVYLSDSSPAISDSTISDNTTANGRGGGLFLANSSPALTNTTISGNAASNNDGGGLYLNDSSPTITGATISENTAGSNGGGLYLYSSSPTIAGATISDNTSAHGGGLYLDNSSPTISESTISGNTANNGQGGGLYLINSSPSIADTSVISNTGAFDGGGLYVWAGTPAITGGTISGNSAEGNGGGLLLRGASATITDVTISDNTADSGGGLYLRNDSSPTITRATISENSAGDNGGGLYLTGNSSPAISDSTISDNTTNMNGGGLFLRTDSSPAITGTTISENTAGITGGGLALRRSSPTITGTTISENSAGHYGGGLHLNDDSSPTITNSIIAFSTGGGGGIQLASGNPVIAYSNVFGNAGGNYVDMDDQTGLNGNISEDPLFADAAAGDFHLKSRGGRWDPVAGAWVIDTEHSPCIDSGDPASDFSNEPEPNGGRINMGR